MEKGRGGRKEVLGPDLADAGAADRFCQRHPGHMQLYPCNGIRSPVSCWALQARCQEAANARSLQKERKSTAEFGIMRPITNLYGHGGSASGAKEHHNYTRQSVITQRNTLYLLRAHACML